MPTNLFSRAREECECHLRDLSLRICESAVLLCVFALLRVCLGGWTVEKQIFTKTNSSMKWSSLASSSGACSKELFFFGLSDCLSLL